MKNTSDRAEEQLLQARLSDAVHLSGEKYRACFVGFLDEKEAAFARRFAKKVGFGNYLLWGGHPDAERVIFGAFPDYLEPDPLEFPIQAVTASFRTVDELTHRDFLGSLMATGVNRDTCGDLLVEQGRCVMFLRQEVSEFVELQITKIGRTGVKLTKGMEEPLPQGRGFTPFSAVIASARLDCAVAAALGTSREKAAALIQAGAVMLNHEETDSVSEPVRDGDKLSIRGKGRFLLDSVGPVTKKGRLSLTGRKYI